MAPTHKPRGSDTQSRVRSFPSPCLPCRPWITEEYVSNIGAQRLEISLGLYANGVVYTVFVFENISPRESVDSFSDHFAVGPRTLDLTSERKLTVDGVGGKAFTWEDGVVQFFAKGDRLFQFMAFGAPPDDKRIEEFFSSASLLKNKDVSYVSDGPGRTLRTDH